MKQESNEKIQIEELLKQKRRDRTIHIILIIIIILLLMIYFMAARLGKIGYQQTSGEPTSTIDLIKVTEGDMDITKDTQLNIFKNEQFDGEKMIAPNSKGTYQFCIKNESSENIVYHIRFLDEMQFPINMKYKFKIDNVYIRGNEDNYVSIDELDVEDIIVTKDSINVFTLEWYWEDNDENDTIVGSQENTQYYTLKLEIESNEYEK